MTINYLDQELIKGVKSIFLAGPTPRGNKIESWRTYALQKLEKLGFDGVVYIPETLNKFEKDEIEKLEWKNQALKEATVITFWYPKELQDMQNIESNVEFGHFLKTGKVIYGRDYNNGKQAYLDNLYEKEYNKKPNDELFQLLIDSLELSRSLYRLKSNETSLEELIEKSIDDPSKFYEKIAANLTIEEYHYLKKNLINKSCRNCENMSCRIEQYEKIGYDENNLPIGYDCVGWYNRSLVGKRKVLTKKQ